MTAPAHPEHLIWALWTNNDDGRLVLTNREGEVFHLDPSESPHLAAVLSNHCTDNAERSFVRDSWSEIDEEEEEEE